MSLVCLAHHWLVTHRGGEKVLAEFRRMFPDSPLATLVVKRGDIPERIIGPRVLTSWLQYLPASWRYYKALLPLHPSAFGRLSVPATTRLVLSSDASMVKGLRMPDAAKQVCYCHSPPRYLWEMQDDYAKMAGGTVARWLFRCIAPYARAFDLRSAGRVHAFIANSEFVAQRIRRCYGREATVIAPPVAVEEFVPREGGGDFYLVVSQLVPYKRIDLAISACNQLRRRLIVIGEGSELRRLRGMAGPTVQLLGRQPGPVVRQHIESCRAFLYPQIEDFGITAVEAQAAGRPVIALRAGGAQETVVEGETGVFFDSQSPDGLQEAIVRFESLSPGLLSGRKCRENAERFGAQRFRDEVRRFLLKQAPEILSDYAWPDLQCGSGPADEAARALGAGSIWSNR